MQRRDFLAFSAAAVILPAGAQAAADLLTYKPGLVKQLLAADKTVLVDYYASWCSTCRAQERVVNALRDENSAYDAQIKFVRVDWDADARSPISTDYNIPRRSTLLLLRGDQELGRIVAGTRRGDIKKLLDNGLG